MSSSTIAAVAKRLSRNGIGVSVDPNVVNRCGVQLLVSNYKYVSVIRV